MSVKVIDQKQNEALLEDVAIRDGHIRCLSSIPQELKELLEEVKDSE